MTFSSTWVCTLPVLCQYFQVSLCQALQRTAAVKLDLWTPVLVQTCNCRQTLRFEDVTAVLAKGLHKYWGSLQ